ncbi:MAG: T9SS type A sorting domain-containing protein, partial [Bacteroidales bacterium]|nr:T9SS type A sorting domain-containing protein [Bacteroidales bacterium]
NPSSDIVNISLGEMFVNDIEVRVYDLMGREIITELINDGSNNYSLDFSQSTTGIYFVKIRVNSAITTKKVSIIK